MSKHGSTRRHMSPSQLAMVADKARDYYDRLAAQRKEDGQKAGGRGHKKLPGNDTGKLSTDARDEAGKALGVSGSLVDRGRGRPNRGSSKDEPLSGSARPMLEEEMKQRMSEGGKSGGKKAGRGRPIGGLSKDNTPIHTANGRTRARASEDAGKRVAIAKAIAEEIGNRQGKRTDLDNAELWAANEERKEYRKLVEKIPQVESGAKTREVVAELSGFGNETTYRQAATVVDQGVPELVEAMDEGRSVASEGRLAGRCQISTMPLATQQRRRGATVFRMMR